VCHKLIAIAFDGARLLTRAHCFDSTEVCHIPLQLLILLITQVIRILILVILTAPFSVLSSHRMALEPSDGLQKTSYQRDTPLGIVTHHSLGNGLLFGVAPQSSWRIKFI